MTTETKLTVNETVGKCPQGCGSEETSHYCSKLKLTINPYKDRIDNEKKAALEQERRILAEKIDTAIEKGMVVLKGLLEADKEIRILTEEDGPGLKATTREMSVGPVTGRAKVMVKFGEERSGWYSTYATGRIYIAVMPMSSYNYRNLRLRQRNFTGEKVNDIKKVFDVIKEMVLKMKASDDSFDAADRAKAEREDKQKAMLMRDFGVEKGQWSTGTNRWGGDFSVEPNVEKGTYTVKIPYGINGFTADEVKKMLELLKGK